MTTKKNSPPAPSAVAREIKQKRPFTSPGHEATVGLLLTADVVRRFGAAILEPFGITPQQFNVLRILRGSRPDGLPTLEIAERMVDKSPGVTRLLDRLEKKGLVRRERCTQDRRQVLCWITAKGLSLLEELDGPVQEAAKPFNHLSQKNLRRLVALLDAVRRAHR